MRRARGLSPRAAALILLLVGEVMVRPAVAAPTTWIWRGNLDALREPPVRSPSPRPIRAPDQSLREADSLFRIARSRATRAISAGRALNGPRPAADTGRDTVLVLFRDRDATEFAREVSALVIDSTLASLKDLRKAQKNWDKRLAKRLKFLHGRAKKLESRYRATVIEQFQYAAAMVVDLPRQMRDDLAHRSDVFSIQPLHGAPPLPSGPCGSPDDTAPIGARLMGLDRFRAAGFGSGRIALLDTGVRSSHSMIQETGHVERWVNCGDSLEHCFTAATQEDVDPSGHGTATAAILIGRNSERETNEGVTGARLTSYRVYRRMGSRYGLFRSGAAWAFEDAIRRGYDIIVAEIADTGDVRTLVSRLAGEAFDRGAIVVAAGGNDSLLPLPSPAISPRTLGIGAYCIRDRQPIMAHSRGRTGDGRVKPDLGAPTSAYTAGNASDQQVQMPFGGTSGATPFAAAAALYLKNWMSGGGAATPGEVYAMMLACGDERGVDERKGTGLVVLPAGGTAWWGKAVVGGRQAIQIPLERAEGTTGIEAAIWWPEYGRNGALPESKERATLALQLLAPTGDLATSADPRSVFQRVTLPVASAVNGRWTLTIAGESLPRGAREVYWAAWAKPTP